MDRRSIVVLALLAPPCLSSCGPEPATASEFAEVCGTLGPHRLLALAPGERLHSLLSKHQIGERLYFIAGTGEGSYLGAFTPDTATVYSTGLCGEDPRAIADDIRNVFEREQFPGVLLGCRGTVSGDLFVLDPAGEAAPRLLATDGCSLATWTEHGIVRTEDAGDLVDRLLFYPYPADVDAGPIAPVVLAESIQAVDREILAQIGEVLALDLDGNLLRIDLPGGETAVEQSAVARFDASSDGRYLAWQALPAGNAEDAVGDLVLRDRETGVDTVLAQEPHPFASIRLGATTIKLNPVEWFGGGRVVALSSLAEFEVPVGRRLAFELAEDRWLLEGGDGAWYARDPIAGTERQITDDRGTVNRASVDFMYMFRGEPSDEPTQRELWRYPLDGGEPEQLAVRVIEPGWLADRRIYTVVDPDAEGVGELVLVDPDDLGERRLDDRVVSPWGIFGWFNPLDQRDVIFYEVVDGERSGVWVVRPAAAP